MTGSKFMTVEEQAAKYVLQKERMKETNRLWILAHRDDIIVKVKSYYQLNKERLNKRSVELVKLKKNLQREQIETDPTEIV
jgi:hypothetical protein